MGVGNYSEDDIKEASRAFTGLDHRPQDPPQPAGPLLLEFRVPCGGPRRRGEDFPGAPGQLQRAGHHQPRCRSAGHGPLPVPAPLQFLRGGRTPGSQLEHHAAQRPGRHRPVGGGLQRVRRRYSLHAARAVQLRLLQAGRFSRVKSPAELVISTARMAGNFSQPRPGFNSLAFECAYQGQELLNPPSVESWHTGSEWIDGGALVRRVNFAAGLLGDVSLPGVRSMVDTLRERGNLGRRRTRRSLSRTRGSAGSQRGDPGRIAGTGPQRWRTALGHRRGLRRSLKSGSA